MKKPLRIDRTSKSFFLLGEGQFDKRFAMWKNRKTIQIHGQLLPIPECREIAKQINQWCDEMEKAK